MIYNTMRVNNFKAIFVSPTFTADTILLLCTDNYSVEQVDDPATHICVYSLEINGYIMVSP